MHTRHPKVVLFVVIVTAAVVAASVFLYRSVTAPSGLNQASSENITTEVVADGLTNPWDVAQAPDKTIFYTERAAKISAILDGKPTVIHQPEDVVVRGEGGMLGMTLDPDFTNNRFLFACFNTTTDIRVARYTVAADNRSLSGRDDILTGMPVNPSGRHSGCRLAFSPDQTLWVGTGDAARNTTPQDPASLGGKIIRIDRYGKAADGNLGGPFDTRIYSYGHRNTQGIAFYKQPRNGLIGYSIEHGSSKDDEINILQNGNFGWNPGSGYNESVAMTDTDKYPDAVQAVWSSGSPTIAPSGGTLLEGSQWKSWEGRLMMAVQKGKHVRLMQFDVAGKQVLGEQKILDTFGRVRTVTSGTDGSVYMATDNGKGTDKIIKVTPR